MKKIILPLLLISGLSSAQLFTKPLTVGKSDTLKGSDTQYRNFWDVKKYHISVKPDYDNLSLSGNNTITFEITKDIKNPVFQIDLQEPMTYKFINKDKKLTDFRQGDFIFIRSSRDYKKGEKVSFRFEFSGKPKIAKAAPWDGGWVFSKDKNQNPWMSVAQQGDNASLWLPLKDIWSDEPDEGIIMEIITPKNLAGVGNGRLISKKSKKENQIYVWEVKNPINDYSIVPTIGKLVNFKDVFEGEKGKLDLDYWVLEENLEKAKTHFQQVKPMLKAFEYWFGPYPFYEDSYKLVETPYLGMEHQSNVAYGNQYMNGYLGRDVSNTGVGLSWDFIIVHESGHEWFANNITAKDRADMWIHESFTCYSETLYVEYTIGKNEADRYIQGQRLNILNDVPVIGKYGIQNEGSADMYYKGANMLHTIRQVIGNDQKFKEILRGLNKDFYHQTVTTAQIENYISEKSGIDFSGVFDQYLRSTKIPVMEYQQNGNQLKFRYQNIVKTFKMPIKINENTIISPDENWQTVTLKSDAPVEWNKNYFVKFTALKN